MRDESWSRWGVTVLIRGGLVSADAPDAPTTPATTLHSEQEAVLLSESFSAAVGSPLGSFSVFGDRMSSEDHINPGKPTPGHY